MTSEFTIPIRLLNTTTTPSIPRSGFQKLYFKNTWLTSLDVNGIEKDVVLNRLLSGLIITNTNQSILSTDNIIVAFGKLQSTLNFILGGSFSQIQTDWLQANTTAADYIKNKPTSLSQFINDVGFITIASVPTDISDLTDITNIIPTTTSDLVNNSGFITLSDLPFIPTDTGDLTNGAGFITINEATIWGVSITYEIDAIVGYDEKIYISLQNNNINKIPISEPTYWKEYVSGGGVYIRKSAIDNLIWYGGFAPDGSTEDSAVWTITKLITTTIGDVDSSTTVTNWKWTERNLI